MRLGASVVLACRNPERGREAISKLTSELAPFVDEVRMLICSSRPGPYAIGTSNAFKLDHGISETLERFWS